jgi:hypothetical protein
MKQDRFAEHAAITHQDTRRMPSTEQTSPEQLEKRRRNALRALVDEMLTQIRATSDSEGWTEEERSRAEEDLERIMGQVRREAMRDLNARD